MILRNAILSEERVHLAAQRAHAETPGPTATPPETPPDIPHDPPPPVLSAEIVCAWLAEQDASTRALVARSFAEELEGIATQARTQAYEAGLAKGLAEIRTRAGTAVAALAQVANAAHASFEQECAQLADACADVVAETFVRLAGPALVRREAALGTVIQVLSRVKDEAEVTIRVHARDLEFLQSQEAALSAALPGRLLVIVADPRVELGGCLVEARAGSLDGRLEVQLRGLFETLRLARGGEGHAP